MCAFSPQGSAQKNPPPGNPGSSKNKLPLMILERPAQTEGFRSQESRTLANFHKKSSARSSKFCTTKSPTHVCGLAGPNVFQEFCWDLQGSETGRIRFRGVRFRTPNSVSFSGQSELSEFLSAYYLCANANAPSFSQRSVRTQKCLQG